MILQNKTNYEKQLSETRDKRMKWWREARFGMFVHYGLYTLRGQGEWAMALENWSIEEYEKFAEDFKPKQGAAMEWAKLAKEAGMKYMVLTTRHHEGFSLWDSKVNPYNSMNYGAKRDLVKEFVEACRAYDLKVGFYSSLMDWHHPDSYKCAYDSEARKRFNEYIYTLNEELLTQYGKIDILWYDVPLPMESYDGWNSVEMNQRLRALQPDIIINNRSLIEEDYVTPEGSIVHDAKDWEACMTFNDINWCCIDPQQALPYSYTPQRILRMLNNVTGGAGNLILNIGPKPDGSVPDEAIGPLQTVGKWLDIHKEAVYGKKEKTPTNMHGIVSKISGVCHSTCEDNHIYLWNWVWPHDGQLFLGGFFTKLISAHFLHNGEEVEFEQVKQRIRFKNLTVKVPEEVCGVTVIKMVFESKPKVRMASDYEQLSYGLPSIGLAAIEETQE